MNNASEAFFVLILIIVNGYFAAAEIALISARKSALMQRAEEGSKGAKTALKMTEDPTRLLATIQVAITLMGMLASATAAVSLAEPLQVWLKSLGLSTLSSIAPGLSVFLVTLIISYFTLVLGELVPKRLGLQKADAVATAVARPISFLSVIAAPVVWLLTRSTDLVAKLLGVKEENDDEASEEEIKLMVTEQNSLLDEEKRMIYEIFGLGDTVVREIMVPRVDMTFIEDTLSVTEATRTMLNRGYSRVPVYHEDHDRVVGIIMFKDLVIPLNEGHGDEPVSGYMRTPVFVPETKGILPMLTDMQTSRNQMAIVVDEYGGTAGLVTLEDIVEEVVGEIADEFDRDKTAVNKLGNHEWVVNGTLPVEDATEMGFPLEESDEYDTIAGWILDKLGHIPHVGESVEYENYSYTVLGMRRRRVARIKIVAQPDTDKDSSSVEAKDRDEKHHRFGHNSEGGEEEK